MTMENPATTQPACPDNGYWPKRRAAEYLGVATHTLDYLCRTKQLAFYLIAKKRRFIKADLDAYAARKRISTEKACEPVT